MACSKLKLNTSITFYMVFHRAKIKSNDNIYINGDTIKRTQTLQFLRIIVDEKSQVELLRYTSWYTVAPPTIRVNHSTYKNHGMSFVYMVVKTPCDNFLSCSYLRTLPACKCLFLVLHLSSSHLCVLKPIISCKYFYICR